jgi:hypothetical protein
MAHIPTSQRPSSSVTSPQKVEVFVLCNYVIWGSNPRYPYTYPFHCLPQMNKQVQGEEENKIKKLSFVAVIYCDHVKPASKTADPLVYT